MDDNDLLGAQESLDDDELGDQDRDSGYSPAEHPWAVQDWGTTAREAAGHEDLGHRLGRELPDLTDEDTDGIGDTQDTDGEPIDDEVGDRRAGRLVEWDGENARTQDYWARDVGVDAGAASAEEAAVHIVPDSDSRDER